MTSSFTRRLIHWQKTQGRHDLPWQNTKEAYRIWLSEIMLQQTQVQTVKGYYERFLKRFPNLQILAEATEDEVLALWSGVGYYSRARHLHQAARWVVAKHQGKFPESRLMLETLPGIGRSTAAAICVFAFDAKEAILDGNVKRVLARHGGVRGYPGHPNPQKALWALAEKRLPKKDLIAYTQGLMDLGASLCSRSRPQCDNCPVSQDCVAFKEGLTQELPERKTPKALPQKTKICLIVLSPAGVLLEKRPSQGIWGGLWSLPEYEDTVDIELICRQQFGITNVPVKALKSIEHGFTHYKLTLLPIKVRLRKVALVNDPARWLKLSAVAEAPLPAPIKKLLLTLNP